MLHVAVAHIHIMLYFMRAFTVSLSAHTNPVLRLCVAAWTSLSFPLPLHSGL